MKDNRSRKCLPIPTHKVNVRDQTSYVYHTVTGDITITPMEDGSLRITEKNDEFGTCSFITEGAGVTIDFLRDLHRMDNLEAHYNLEQARKPMTMAERRDLEAWRSDPDHPDRKRLSLFPDGFQRWNLPIDSMSDDEDGTNALDRDPAMVTAWEAAQPQEDERRDCVRDYVGTLSDRQRELYQLVYIDGCSINEAAEIMGVTHQRATAINKQLIANLKKHFGQ